MLRRYHRKVYQRTVRQAHGRATQKIISALRIGGEFSEYGPNSGQMYRVITEYMPLAKSDHIGGPGFADLTGRSIRLYPLANAIQPMLVRIDRWYCDQIVFAARKPDAPSTPLTASTRLSSP